MYMKKYIFLAASALALASCSSDDLLSENPGNVQNATNAINFSGDAGKITRATSNTGDDHVKLDNQFKVYGTKNADGKFVTVFPNYSVLYNENLTTSNTNKWEYVKDNQTIKYWDYSASVYHFVAGSPISAFTYNAPYDLTTGADIKSATISGLAGHINANEAGTALETNPVYVAAPVKVVKENYQKPVTFNFVRQQAMVRVGLYETIPGYSITEIKFYAYDTDGTTLTVSEDHNVILTSATPDYFVGGKDVKGTVNYKWEDTPSYTYEYKDEGLTKSKNWYAGKFAPHTPLATTSSEPTVATLYGKDKDMSDKGYFTVLPTPSATVANAIVIKCDYTLTSDDGSGETIKVTGATAAIPAAYSKWDANTRYTYLFKISQNTNGTTGNPDEKDPAGLYPITFNAVVTEMADKTQGTTTTVATPSITTHQEGSVTDNGIEYKSGKEIKVTVTNANGVVQTLSKDGTAVGNIAVYKLTGAINEAELQVKGITGETTVEGTVTNNVYTFTPDVEGYYAIQYLTTAAVGDKPAAYTYKVVYVK